MIICNHRLYNNSKNRVYMSKYKYEKEFMFSIRRLDEVQMFLENEEGVLDLPAIRDNNKNTVIHHTAYHNQPKVLECYLRYYRKKLDRENFSIGEIKTYTRYFLDQPNAEGYTAAHYAAYRGNIAVIKLLQKYQAHFALTNHLRMTMLHLAAQGDKPSTFLYLHQKNMNLNQRDQKMTTALHWASFAGAEKIVEYLLVQEGIEINPVDAEGLTPLHLATTYGNSKIVKKLLIAGADRRIRNRKGERALDIAKKKQFWGIVRMLTDKYSLLDKLKILCNAKSKYEPIAKSYKYPWAFVVVWLIISGVSFGAIALQNIIITILQGMLLVVILALFGSLVLGVRKQKGNPHTYTEFASNTIFYHLCMVCIKEMRQRQHHCPICRTCITQYDHHCTWINNCVGKHNLARFNILLILLEMGLAWVAFIAISVLIELASGDGNDLFVLREWVDSCVVVVYIGAGVCLLPVVLFGVPLLFLILVQMKNLLLGKTTYQRFSRVNQSILTRQSSLLMNQPENSPKLSLKNCVVMCCDEDASKIEHASSTTSSFVGQS